MPINSIVYSLIFAYALLGILKIRWQALLMVPLLSFQFFLVVLTPCMIKINKTTWHILWFITCVFFVSIIFLSFTSYKNFLFRFIALLKRDLTVLNSGGVEVIVDRKRVKKRKSNK